MKEETMPVQAPRTVGPHLHDMTLREQAAEAWAKKAAGEQHRAERAARALVLRIFGHVEIEFNNFIPDEYANRFEYGPFDLATFEVEGLQFRYHAGSKDTQECLVLIDRCPFCEHGIRQLVGIEHLSDIGQFYATTDPTKPWKRCDLCKKLQDDELWEMRDERDERKRQRRDKE